MDTFKPYSDTPDNLEKGGPPALEPLPVHSEVPCSAEPAQNWGRRSFAKRHLIAFGAVVLTWWLVLSCGRRALYDRPLFRTWRWEDDRFEHSPLPDEDIVECVGGSNWTTYYDQPSWAPDYPYGAETNFTLPLDSDVLYLISRGILQQGLVNIEQSTQVVDTVDVHVRVGYFSNGHLGLARVCRMQGADNENGVGIFTPPKPYRSLHRGPKRDLEFDVTVTLPAGSDGPLSVEKLDTELLNYSQNVTNLGESVFFDQISLKSANGRLSVQSVTADVGELSLLNGEIDGQISVQSSLDLNIANGRVTSKVNLLHREDTGPPHLAIHVVNGEVDAEISLASEASIGGDFDVDVHLTNGKLGLKFTDSPVDSVLRCLAETTVGDIEVELASAYEGTYSLENRLGPKFVTQRDVEDPSGRDRHRVISIDKSLGRLQGEVRWMESDGGNSDNEGSVVLKSLLSPVKLVI